MTKAPERQALQIHGISHFAVNVGDIGLALDFYCKVLCLKHEPDVSLPDCGSHAVVSAASGQRVALCQSEDWQPSPESGIHHAYRVTPSARKDILERIAGRGIQVFSYKEMRPAEVADNCYFHDPFANRIQLVSSGPGTDGGRSSATIEALDHAVIQTIDIEWSEKFYVGVLGLPVDCNIGRRTADYVFARRWKEGKEDMAPGIMRLEKRYSTIHGTDPVPRPNMQLFVTLGTAVLGLYLTNRAFQEPPEEMAVGTPRIAFRVDRQTLPTIVSRLESVDYVNSAFAEHPPGSPVRQSLYCRDTSGNFIEFCC